MGWMKKTLLVVAALAAILSSATARCDEALDRAIALTSQKRYPEARDVLDSILEQRPDYSYAQLLHGILRARAGRLNEAIDIFEKLRTDHPDMPEPYNNLAVLYAVQGRLDDARAILVTMLEREPNAVTYANLGDVYSSLARRAYDRARELDPDGEMLAEERLDSNTSIPGMASGTSITDAMRAGPPDVGLDPDDSKRTRGTAAAMRDGTMPSNESEPVESVAVVTQSAAGPLAAVTQSAIAAVPSATCVRVTGFRDRGEANDAAQRLRSYGASDVNVHQDQQEVITRHRVFLPPFSSRTKAYEELSAIRTRGVKDIAVIGPGDLANGLSFGVYASRENVQRRVTALRELGYDVRTGAAEVELVDGYVVKARATVSLRELEDAWAPLNAAHAIQSDDCG